VIHAFADDTRGELLVVAAACIVQEERIEEAERYSRN
jgi:hypothetical protein